MGDMFKNKLVQVLAVVSVLLLIASIKSCADSYRHKNARDKEMAQRLDLEEKLHKFTQEKTGVDQQVQKLSQELASEKAARLETQNALAQEQQINKSLKEEVEKVTKLKDTLEQNLKEALVNSKTQPVKK